MATIPTLRDHARQHPPGVLRPPCSCTGATKQHCGAHTAAPAPGQLAVPPQGKWEKATALQQTRYTCHTAARRAPSGKFGAEGGAPVTKLEFDEAASAVVQWLQHLRRREPYIPSHFCVVFLKNTNTFIPKVYRKFTFGRWDNQIKSNLARIIRGIGTHSL